MLNCPWYDIYDYYAAFVGMLIYVLPWTYTNWFLCLTFCFALIELG